jgi:transposase InsO family protein
MPWKETTAVDHRNSLIDDWLTGHYAVTSLAEAYGISRQKAHKWIKRFQQGGRPALEDRSRAPQRQPRKTPEGIRDLVVALRRERPRWGAPKILAVLSERHPSLSFPSERTVHSILREAGLVRARTRRTRRERRGPAQPLTESTAPNDVWSIDFKGDFLLGNGVRCHPLTITDHFSRYLLACRALSSESFTSTQETLVRVFREYGLPRVIRSDNGRPFGSNGALGLSRLSVWLIKLGVAPEHIQAGRPDQNGRHERMHRDLKAETTRPSRHSMRAQQLAFTRFRRDFNEVRPHEALGQIPPSRVYQRSERRPPRRVESPSYPLSFETRFVRGNGEICWKSRRVFVGAAFHGETVGLREVDDGLWIIQFGALELGLLNERKLKDGLLPYSVS